MKYTVDYFNKQKHLVHHFEGVCADAGAAIKKGVEKLCSIKLRQIKSSKVKRCAG